MPRPGSPATAGTGQARVMTEKKKHEFHWVLRCPCGTTLTGLTEDEIVEVAFAHLRELHPEMADGYEREHVLFMAQRLVRS
jgi:hypothetical protein